MTTANFSTSDVSCPCSAFAATRAYNVTADPALLSFVNPTAISVLAKSRPRIINNRVRETTRIPRLQQSDSVPRNIKTRQRLHIIESFDVIKRVAQENIVPFVRFPSLINFKSIFIVRTG